jgi:hypothetical protein
MCNRFSYSSTSVLVAFIRAVAAVVAEENQMQLQRAHPNQPFGKDDLLEVVMLVIFNSQLQEQSRSMQILLIDLPANEEDVCRRPRFDGPSKVIGQWNASNVYGGVVVHMIAQLGL